MKKLSVLYVVFLALFAVPTQAEIIYDNFGPGDTYNPSAGWTLSVGSPTDTDSDQGSAFALESFGMDYYLDTIDLAVGLVSGSNELDLWLMADSAGEPGTIIESFHFSDEMGSFGDANAPLTANSLLNPLLEADEQYWLIASATGPDTWAAWNLNSTGDVGLKAYRADLGTWGVSDTTLAAFRVTGTSAPISVSEPATMLLLGSGLVWLVGFRRRFNKG
jgi:hypothetical protein